MGGGLLTAVNENLTPVLITAGQEEDSEILTVQVKAGEQDIRIINAYGPQEDVCSKDDIYKFWQEIEQEISTAKDDNCLIVIQLDANAKIGKENIKDDPHDTTANGKILLDLVERQNLTIVNTLEKCSGVITRERITTTNVEKSVIDYVIVCEGMMNYFMDMQIDDKRIFVLTKYAGKNGAKRKTISDHNILFSRFSILFDRKSKTVRKEFFDLKNKDGQKAFLKETSDNEDLLFSFSPNCSFSHNANVFFKSLNRCIFKCFKKVRITTGGKSERIGGSRSIYEMMNLKTKIKIFLKNSSWVIGRKVAEEKLEEIEKYLTENCASTNAETVKEYVSEVKNEEGNFSQLKLWKLKQKLIPKSGDPPMAKKDENGTLITSPELLKSLYIRTYKNRLRNRDMKKELLDVFFLKDELWKSRLEELRKVKTLPWNNFQLRKTLKSLKKNKTADPNGMIHEIFKEECLGNDLETSLLNLFNGIKETFFFPDFLLKQNICTIYKNKGSRLDMNNDRGIFILTAMKKILDKLIYFDKRH